MSEIVKTRRRSAVKLATTPGVLTSLGIEFRRGKDDEGFWEANRFTLPDIYREFLSEARNRLRELHPDTGGNGYEFGEFIEAVKRTKKSFARYLNIGIGERLKDESEHLFVPVARKNTEGFAKPSKILGIVREIKAGTASDSFIRWHFRIDHNTLKKVKRIIPLGVTKGCPCGLPRNHRFYSCSYRIATPIWREYEQFREDYYTPRSDAIKARTAQWLRDNREKASFTAAEYRAAHRALLCEKQKQRYHGYLKTDPEFKQKEAARREKNRRKQRAWAKKWSIDLADGYIREQLSKDSGRRGIRKLSAEWTQEEVNAKREVMLANRMKRLTDDQVLAIRATFVKGKSSLDEFAARYGCERSTVWNIISFRTRVGIVRESLEKAA